MIGIDCLTRADPNSAIMAVCEGIAKEELFTVSRSRMECFKSVIPNKGRDNHERTRDEKH
jgi:hypothetical protein